MDKKIRNLLILIIILALLVIGYVIVRSVVREGGGAAESETDATPDAIPVVTVDEKTFSHLAYTHDADGDGVAERYAFTRGADGLWVCDERPDIPLDGRYFTYVCEFLNGLTAARVLTDQTEEQLAGYGLTKPQKTVWISDENGVQTVFIGAYNAYNGTYCISLGSLPGRVLFVNADIGEAFGYGLTDLVLCDDLPADGAITADTVRSVTYTKGDRTVVLTYDYAAFDGDGVGVGDRVWTRTVNGGEPVTVDATLGQSLLTLLGGMDYLTCESVDEEELAAHGLNGEAAVMVITWVEKATEDDNSTDGEAQEVTHAFRLTLGDLNEYGYYYVNPTDTTLTMLLGGSAFAKLFTYDDADIAAAP